MGGAGSPDPAPPVLSPRTPPARPGRSPPRRAPSARTARRRRRGAGAPRASAPAAVGRKRRARRRPPGRRPASSGCHRSSKPSYAAVTTAGRRRTSARPAADHRSPRPSGVQKRMLRPSSFASAAGIERDGRVPEAAQQRHLAGVVPDGGGQRPARPGDAPHLAHARVRVGHEVHDELRERLVERGVVERQRLGRRDLDPDARHALPARLGERRRRLGRRDVLRAQQRGQLGRQRTRTAPDVERTLPAARPRRRSAPGRAGGCSDRRTGRRPLPAPGTSPARQARSCRQRGAGSPSGQARSPPSRPEHVDWSRRPRKIRVLSFDAHPRCDTSET